VKLLKVFCEGATEQAFCRLLLQPHLFPQGDGSILTLAVGKKDHHHVYGLGRRRPYSHVHKFIRNTIKGEKSTNVYYTSFFDLYALPDDFPGKAANVRNPANPTAYAVALESAFGKDVGYHRFIPYIQLHEFETILFAGPEAFAESFENCSSQIQSLKAIVDSVATIEHIDDGRDTAPSKRIIAVIKEYEGRKSTAGPDIAKRIGLSTICDKCPHFAGWLKQLECLAWEAP